MHEVEVEARSAAPAERVWELLADARSWPAWAACDEAEVEEGRGLGELRRFRSGRLVSRERVTGFEPARALRCELVSGLPVRDHRCEVTLAPLADGGTRIRWRSTFAARIPGTSAAIRRQLARLAAERAGALALAAESH